MSKKDYIKFAAMFKEMLSDYYLDTNNGSEVVILDAVHRACDIFQDDNPNFDRDRFIRACREE